MNNLIPVEKSLFFSKNDTLDPRLGDIVTTNTAVKNSFVVIGYPDDQGIKMNGGRPGAKNAPDRIRKYFYKMTPYLSTTNKVSLVDVGNLQITSDLKINHESAQNYAEKFYNAQNNLVSLGGGHDYGFPDAAAFLETQKKSNNKPLVINFDAHLDVRPNQLGDHSGTPFYRLLEKYKDFEFLEVGIQPQCNSQSHLDWCKSKGTRILTTQQIYHSGTTLITQMQEILKDLTSKARPTFISIDIDFFSSSIAPGASQSWPGGIDFTSFIQSFAFLLKNLNVLGLGIYEVSPDLDHDDQTSKLAAQIMHYFIYNRSL